MRGCRDPGHPRDGERRENPHVIERPIAQQHPAEPGQVTGGAEQPGMTGDPTHPPRRRVVHPTAQHDGAVAAARPGQRRARFGRRDPRSQRRGWIEPGVPHPERPKDSVARELVEGLTGHPPDDLPEHEEVDVAVDKPLARTRLRHLVGRARDRRAGALEDLLQGQIGTQPGHMGQQMLDRDPVLAVAREFGQVGRDAVAEPETPLLDKDHDARRRRHHLRQRRQIEDGVERHHLPRPIHRAGAERPLVDDLPGVPDDDHSPGQPAVPYRGLDQRVDKGQSGPVELGRDRRGQDDQTHHTTYAHRGGASHPTVSVLCRHRLDYTFRGIKPGSVRRCASNRREKTECSLASRSFSHSPATRGLDISACHGNWLHMSR